jgi:hypothetical protein
MIKATMKMSLAVLTGCLLASGAYAAPISLTDAQMDSVAAGGDFTDVGFVCPVIPTVNVLNAQQSMTLVAGESYTVAPAGATGLTVPLHATNDGGAGIPNGDFVSPGDDGYTAIWAVPPES